MSTFVIHTHIYTQGTYLGTIGPSYLIIIIIMRIYIELPSELLPFTLINEDQTIPSVSYAEEEHDTSNSSHYPAKMVSAAEAAASPTHQ